MDITREMMDYRAMIEQNRAFNWSKDGLMKEIARIDEALKRNEERINEVIRTFEKLIIPLIEAFNALNIIKIDKWSVKSVSSSDLKIIIDVLHYDSLGKLEPCPSQGHAIGVVHHTLRDKSKKIFDWQMELGRIQSIAHDELKKIFEENIGVKFMISFTSVARD